MWLTKRRYEVLVLLRCAICSAIVLWIASSDRRYPANEWHSRHLCKTTIANIAEILYGYLSENNNKMPVNLYELQLDKRSLICPSQYVVLKKAGLLRKECPSLITSYMFMTPAKDYSDIKEGAIVIKENSGNHISADVGQYHYRKGYHAIVKQGNYYRLIFVDAAE